MKLFTLGHPYLTSSFMVAAIAWITTATTLHATHFDFSQHPLTPTKYAAIRESKVPNIKKDTFGTTSDGKPIARYTLENRNGSVLKVIELGATTTELHVRDRNGNLEDFVLGFDTTAEYEENTPYVGCTTGRVANRITNGNFELDGVNYQLAKNFGENHLHGGVVGLHQRVWNSEPVVHKDGPAVRFTYLSPDGEEGYPGNLLITVVYVLTQDDGFRIEYEATTDKPTPVNLTNHTYFNLAAAGKKELFNHRLTIHADKTTERGNEGIPTGAIVPVKGTPLDFTKPKRIGKHIGKLEVGYDHNYVLNHGSGENPALSAEVFDPESGRVMRLFTTEPGVQLYTSYYMENVSCKGGSLYSQWQALCLETQHFPDSLNKPNFPSIILRPGKVYRQITEYRFSVR